MKRILVKITFLLSLSLLLIPIEALHSAPNEDLLTLVPIPANGRPVGTTILWIAFFEDSDRQVHRYQFSVGRNSSSLQMVREFSPDNFFRWTPMEDGTFVVKVVAENMVSGQRWSLLTTYDVASRIDSDAAAVTGTSHPLVLLYSAPACQTGRMRVRFRPRNDRNWQFTPWQPCNEAASQNQYVGGLTETTWYEMAHEVESAGVVTISAEILRRTGSAELELPEFRVLEGPTIRASAEDAVLLHAINGGDYDLVFPVATNLDGELIWYYKFRAYENPEFPWHVGEYLVRPLNNGRMLMFFNYDGEFDQILREIDLIGEPVRETNVERINMQLAQMGHDPVGYLHHEAIRLDNGHTLLLGSVERIIPDYKGGEATNIVADMIIDLDTDWQVVWAWNSFDHLDINREASLNEVCTAVTVGCPPISLDFEALDWTHSNAIAYTHQDGNLLVSVRNQDWIIKIDYANGTGDGDVIWRLGQDGDFTLTSIDEYPWFTHQHDIYLDGDQIVVYDNGNLRCESEPTNCHSRGQVYKLDEAERVATLELNVDLGHYSTAFGSAQKLSNGNYQFLSGILLPDVVSQSVEVRPSGTVAFVMETEGSQYRSFRMPDMYTPLVGRDGDGVMTVTSRTYLPFIRR